MILSIKLLNLTSIIGLEASTFFSTWVSVDEPVAAVAKNLIAYLAETVLPAPDSPETIIDWSWFSLREVKGDNKKYDWLLNCDWVAIPLHFRERFFRHGENVRIKAAIVVFVITISKNRVLSIYRKFLVWIDCYQYDSCDKKKNTIRSFFKRYTIV